MDAGHGSPLSMTYAAVPALRADPELARIWEPRLTRSDYEAGLTDPAGKRGVLAGMEMTENQAVPTSGPTPPGPSRCPTARSRVARRTG